MNDSPTLIDPLDSPAPTPVEAGRPRRAARGRATRALGIIASGAVLLAACGTGAATPPSSTAPSAPAPASGSPSAAPSGSPAASSSAGGSTRSAVVASTAAASTPVTAGPFAGGVLIADRGNGRILIVDDAGRVVWRFPARGSLPPGQRLSADDAFLSPDGKTIVANDEAHQVIDRIDIATRRVVWQFGHYGAAGSSRTSLNTPDDAYPLANGDVVVADIRNCRILEIAPDKSIVRQWGRTGVCVDRAPTTFGMPNGDTPLLDGGLLITEITGSRVVRLSAAGAVLFDVHVPVRYPSDAQLDANGNVVVADFSSPGAVVSVSPKGRLLWRYAPTSGRGRLDHPSLATPLPDGLVSVNDDFRHRLIVIDPRSGRIVWQYGTTGVPGSGPNHLSDPDGHQPLPAGLTL